MKQAKPEGGFQRRSGKDAAAEGGLAAVRAWPARTKSFLEDVRAETKRVTWPSRSQIQATTVVVIWTVFFFGVYFGLLDQLFSTAVGYILSIWG